VIQLAPIVAAGELEMVDLGGSAARFGDIDGFLDCRFDPVTLAAHMRGVDAAANRDSSGWASILMKPGAMA
jgi:hypothetical protein